MNFLAEVLTSAENVELDEINKKVPELKSTVETVKTEVICYIENVYVKYSGKPKHNKMLLNKALELEKEMTVLKNNGDNLIRKMLDESCDELKKHCATLETINFTLYILSILCHINDSLINLTDLLNKNKYLECMKLICDLEKLVNQVPDDEYVEILDELKIAIDTKKNTLSEELNNVIADNVTIMKNEEEQYVMLKVKKDITYLEQALIALYYDKSVVDPLHVLARSLWNYIFVPVVDQFTEVSANEDDQYYILKVITVDRTTKSGYLKVFSNLRVILQFLSSHCNIKINDELSCLGYIGMDIRDNLSELIIKNCLQDTIPSNSEELHKYKTVIEDTKLLEEVLKSCYIFAEDTASIYEYANNVDVLYINKKCNEYLITSQNIMKKDLHDMVEIGTPYNTNNPLESNVNEFLQCSVSQSTNELLQFIEKIIQQAIAASNVCAGRLMGTVQNIIKMYGSFVPEYHKKLLQTIPQQVALFHNNCLYMAFKLTQWNQQYSSEMLALLNENCFRVEIFQLQEVASKTFTAYVEGQLKQIGDIMNESGLEGSTLEKLEPVTEKSIRQCLRQQELLKTVWKKVLSYPVYNKTLGIILNSLCNNIINSVVKFEDISCEAAEQLVEILKIIFTRGPKLFTDPKEISLYVSSWYKLNELNFVLGAKLLDINDRWADGKGPLAMQFKSIELKQLIRALFQNTDKRSAVLAKIQD